MTGWRSSCRDPYLSRATRNGCPASSLPSCPMNLSAEVDNGGFDPFFFNSSGHYALDTGTALRDVGLTSIEKIYEKALAAFPGTPERDTRARRAQMQNRLQGDGRHVGPVGRRVLQGTGCDRVRREVCEAHQAEFAP